MYTIVVADDDQSILDATTLLLEYEGYTVIPISEGDIVHKIATLQPDVVLLDIWLSGMNGGELTKALKADNLSKNIPIILFSANRDIKKIAEASGADDYLIKPFNLSELLEKVKKQLPSH